MNTLADQNLDSQGTAQRLSPVDDNVHAVWATVQAHPDNAGRIYVGDSQVSATRGIILTAGQSYTFQAVADLASVALFEIFFDGNNTGDDVKCIYQKR